jgi:outer membrane protein OmpA-like peptidoglycan-associated protein
MSIHPKARTSRFSGLGRVILLSALLWVPGTGKAEPKAVPGCQATVIPGTARAINYRNITGATIIGFRGTALMPRAGGSAKVQNRGGSMSVKAKFTDLEPAIRLSPENLTYVLWAVTPVGRPVNLGEVIVRKNGKAEIEAHTNLQTFGLIVTAEPHFAVAQVGSMVVLENAMIKETRGQVEEVEARYELLPRGACLPPGSSGERPPVVLDRKVSPYVYQAINAFNIARAEGAELYAPEEFHKALALMNQLEAEKKKWKQPAILLARQLVQQAEDARLVAAARQEQARLEKEHQAAEQARMEAEAARAETDLTRAQAESAREEAERARLQAAQEAQKAMALASREVSAEKLARRKKLREQLSRLLDTRETEHGVEVSLSDLLFPTGKATLLPATREKLAKVAGIVLTYPGVKVRVEGHTDSTGPAAFNERLSHRRAHAVRDFLVSQGLASEGVTAHGFGSGRALASNDTLAGRQQNRRVELILTGGAIGF